MYTLIHLDNVRDINHEHHYLYQLYYNIMVKTHDLTEDGYKYYGGRGIQFYWSGKPKEFMLWILNNTGPRPDGLILDRQNNNGHYEPGNLRWASRTVQALNQRQRQCSTNTGERCINTRLTRRGTVTYVVRIDGTYIGCRNNLNDAIALRNIHAYT